MSATTVGINEGAYQRLLHLIEQTGRPAGVILEQALVEYERKISGGANSGNGPARPAAAAAEEAELFEDVGRIRAPRRSSDLVAAQVVPVPRRVPRLGADGEE